MAQQTGAITLALVTIDHPQLSSPLRICNNNEDVASRGNTYTAMAVDLLLPDDTEGASRARLVMDNVSQWLTPTIRTLTGGFTVLIELVTASNLAASPPEFDIVEIAFLPMTLSQVDWSAGQATGTLTHENTLNNRFPAGSVDPYDFPGAF